MSPMLVGVSVSSDKPSVLHLPGELLSLTKPRLSALVLCTTAGGMWLAPGDWTLAHAALTLVATAGTVGAANALNCYLERDRDRFMARTATRPLPAGRMEPSLALGFGVALAAVSIPALALGVNLLTGALALLAFVSYVFAYTPLKARTEWAMWVGALPGALPPLMGWTAMRNEVSAVGLVLFGILFFWQLPHFLAISLFRKEEYRNAGLASVPLRRGEAAARLQAMLLVVPLVFLSLLLWQLDWAGPLYLVCAMGLGALFFGMAAWGYWKNLGAAWARKFFLVSLVYLTGLFVALLLDGGPRG